jgi:serine/threonine protein kinase
VKLLTEIRHPNVVLFYGVSFDDSTNDCYILTEYCKNGCLQDVLLDLEREITDAQKLQMVVDVAIGMRFLHASNLMHRDLKSANVLVAGRLELKICDFGISRRIDATEMTGSIGTIPWT